MGITALAAAVILSTAAGAQAPASNADVLPGSQRDLKFELYLADLDLEDTERYQVHFKTGGTSIGFKISLPGKRKKAMFMAPSSATNIEGEVVSYRLSRLLGVSRLFNPVDYYELGPKAAARFHAMLRDDEADKWRRINTKNLFASLARKPDSLLGIVKFRHKRRSQGVEQLTNGANRLNSEHLLAGFLLASGPQPPRRKLRLAGVGPDKKKYPYPSERASELARQLSIIFVVDMLTEQWDRFSGGNIEVYALKDGRLRFVARDNGGAGFRDKWTWYDRYSAWVTRFDRAFLGRVKDLNAFLQGRNGNYEDFNSVEQLKKALGFRKDLSFKTFKQRLSRLAERDVPELERRYGEGIYFAPVGDRAARTERAPGRSPGQSVASLGAGSNEPSKLGLLDPAAGAVSRAEPIWTDDVRPQRRKSKRARQKKRRRRIARVSEPSEPEGDNEWQKKIFEGLD